MPSRISELLRLQIKLIKPIISQFDIQASRNAQDRLGDLYAKVIASRVAYVDIENGEGVIANWAVPKKLSREAVILYIHGGGYVAGSLSYSRLFGGVLANHCQARVLCAGYSLAPEMPFPAALNDVRNAYVYLLGQGFDNHNIILAGESAGGGLLLCLMHMLKAQGIAMPAGLISISPWVDLMLSGESIEHNHDVDVALKREQLENYAQLYALHERTNPMVSPIYGDFALFPPALVFAGGDEILLDDAKAVKRAYEQAGEECELIIEEGMWHAYPLYNIPESKRALAKMAQFIDEHIKEKAENKFE